MGILYRDDSILIEDGQIIFSENPNGCVCCNPVDSESSEDCDRRLIVTWESEPVNGDEVIQQGPSPVFMHTTTIEFGGVSVEVEIDAELIGLPECISNDFNDDLTFTLRSTLVSNPPHTEQGFFGDVDILSQTGNAETITVSATASSVNDYFGRAFVRFEHPDFPIEPRVFAVEWIYVDQN